jgi:hypothetical protein
MARIVQITGISFLVLLVAGCNPPEEPPIWEQVKVGDLAPSPGTESAGDRPIGTINFNVYVIEVPAENVRALDGIWQMLYPRLLRFRDLNAFNANLFSAGYGQVQMWGKLAELLDGAGAKTTPALSLLLSEGRAQDITVVKLFREQPLYYFSTAGSMERLTAGPGQLSLRIGAGKIPGSRGVCYVEVVPVLSPPGMSPVPQLEARARAGEVLFGPAGFGLKMGPGDLFFFGPEEYADDGITLRSLLFCMPEGRLFPSESEAGQPTGRPELKPAIRVILVICTSVNV